ncbi:nicotinamide riboside transporter PnuC [Lactococcus fujiensis]|uniref:nicotinamide riboside transporter PnuC n=1 Tax=Lactococcus fujiensis TaxID=610251 RepID=UPI000BDF2E83|nr:nicotinamide riboside transporter PnuC [Lactococcus fujiensis]
MNKNVILQGLKDTFNLKIIFKELTTMTIKDNLLMSVLLAVQILVYFITGSFDLMSNLSLIVGIFTIVNLILVNRGRLTNYAWGTVSAVFWLIVAIKSQLFGDMFSQIYYVVMQFVGIYAWQKSLNQTETKEVAPRKISLKMGLLSLVGFAVIYVIVLATSAHLNGQQIILDATLLPLAIIGQMLMTFGYRSQWLAWFLIDFINVVIWYNNWQFQGNSALGMFILQILMLVNAIYGAYLWFKKPSIDEYQKA